MKKNFNFMVLISIFLFISQFSFSQQSKTDTTWNKWKFLIGTWEGLGSGKPGEGTGYFSFNLDLDGKILVRKNHNDFPATKDRPASVHDDLLIVYKDFSGNPNKAIYFDCEDHVINYSISYSDKNLIILTSDLIPKVPRFKLSYNLLEDGKVKIVFEFAPPDKPEAFSKYIEGLAQKK
jgi:hypothetical protein